MKKILIVDDNDRYALNLQNYFHAKGISTDRAVNAKLGFEMFSKTSDFDMIISDITMESQTSGLWMMRKIYKTGYKGVMVIASTGFDVWGVMGISKFILTWFCGLDWMIPKVPLKKGEVLWIPTQKSKELSSPI